MSKVKGGSLFFILVLMLFIYPCRADVVLDGTMGTGGVLTGPDIAITADMGQQRGGNLFHSFESFNLGEPETATFSGPDAVENIISRVTGGESSLIDGTIRSTIPGADLYFVNPAGVVFGAHARLDVSGSFHVSTADYLKLGKEGRFDASALENTILTVSPPSAFGFLTDSPAPIIFNGSGSAVTESVLEWEGINVPEGETFSIIGGDITITSGLVFDKYKVETEISAPSGRINVASVASPGEVVETETGLDVDSFSAMGDITISDGSLLDVSGAGAGDVYIRGNNFVIESGNFGPFYSYSKRSSGIYAESIGEDGGVIDIDVRNFTLTKGATLMGGTTHSGKSVDINIKAKESVYIGGSDGKHYASIESPTYSLGDGGKVTIKTSELTLDDSGYINTSGSHFFSSGEGKDGTGGDIDISADRMEVKNWASIFSSSFGAGRTGNITVNVTESLSLTGNEEEPAGTRRGSITVLGTGKADCGTVSVTAGSLYLNDGYISAQNTGEGNAGAIAINVGTLEVTNEGFVSAKNRGSGQSGDISINAGSSVYLHDNQSSFSISTTTGQAVGKGGSISITTPSLRMENFAVIEAGTVGAGEAGDIIIDAGEVELTGGAYITNSTEGAGNAGVLQIHATTGVTLSGRDKENVGSALLSNSSSEGGGGQIIIQTPKLSLSNGGTIRASSGDEGSGAGDITVDARTVRVTEGGSIASVTSGEGDGGDIEISATEHILVKGIDTAGGQSAIINSTIGEGDAGTIILSTERLEMGERGTVQSATKGAGNGGEIQILAGDVEIRGGAWIDGSSLGSGEGGKISVQATGSISLSGEDSDENPSGLFSDAKDSGSGGKIEVETNSLLVSEGALIRTRTTGSGDAGNITIKSERTTVNGGARVVTSSEAAGNGGSVELAAGEEVLISGADGNGAASGVFSDATGSGEGGKMTITAPLFEIEEGGSLSATGSNSAGAGDVTVETERFSMRSDALINTESTGEGGGGNILVNAGDEVVMENATISAESESSDGGNIQIIATELISLKDSKIMVTARGGFGNGGNIFLDPTYVILENSEIVADAKGGTGGNITIEADNLIYSPNTRISASSELGIDGEVIIDAPPAEFINTLAPLSASFVTVDNLSPAFCASEESELSRFIVKRRDGAPPAPDNFLTGL